MAITSIRRSVAIWLCGLTLLFAAQADLEGISRQAREAMITGRYADAVRLYEQMANLLPNEPGARLNLAVALDAAGRPREAVKNLEQIKAAELGNHHYWFLLGIEYQKLQQPAKAVDPLERAVSLDPANLNYRLELADAYLGSGAPARAEAAFRELASKRPENAKYLQGLVRSQLALSSEAYQTLVQVAPGSSFAYALAALASFDNGDAAKAAALYRRALLAQPPAPWLQSEVRAVEGLAVAPSGKTDSAADAGPPLAQLFHQHELRGVLDRTSGTKAPEPLYWRARACTELAKDSLARMAALPPSSEGHELLGQIFRDAGRWEDSLAEFREAIRFAPNDKRLQGELAKALWSSRRYEEAATLLTQLAAAAPERADWEFVLGDSLLNLGQPEQALLHVRRAAGLAPADLAIQALLGRILVQTGDFQAAAPVLERAAAQDRDGSIHFQLATAYRNLGRSDLARQALARQKEIEDANRRGGTDAAGPPVR